ncbi:hypothetical protein SSCG_01728 [Streptomyces clavuligerus]|nr:hypothetical protein SSCG_01728 [Streptomyces clavuligerus]
MRTALVPAASSAPAVIPRALAESGHPSRTYRVRDRARRPVPGSPRTAMKSG